jgi:hypothetical protein
MLSGEATNTNFIVFDWTRSELELTIYRTRGEHANYYAIDAVTETGDDIFNEAELNEIKIDGNHEIFEVPEPNGKLRRRTHN